MPASTAPGRFFRPGLYRFLEELARNNRREWFQANEGRFRDDVRDPALRFIEAAGPGLARLSPQIVADPRPVGGSLFRIHRDLRFARDRRPYKTHLGIHFAHAGAKRGEGGLPGFYLHLAPEESFVAAGMWGPSADQLGQIRSAIVADPNAWMRSRPAGMEPDEDALKRVPPGFDAAHPRADDLRRRRFTASASLTRTEVTGPAFLEIFLGRCRALSPLNGFLAGCVGAPY